MALALLSSPLTFAKAEVDVQFTITGSLVTPTLINTTIISGSASLTLTSITDLGLGSYILHCTVPRDIPAQVASYLWTITVGVENVITGLIALTVEAGWLVITLVDPLTTIGHMLYGFTAFTPLTGHQLEFRGLLNLIGALNSAWTWSITPDSNQVTDIRVVTPAGTVSPTTSSEFTASRARTNIVVDTSIRPVRRLLKTSSEVRYLGNNSG